MVKAGNGGRPTTMLWTRAAVRWVESATSIVKLNVPLAAGVPPTTPEEALSARPSGSAPAGIRQEYGGWPPVACSVKL